MNNSQSGVIVGFLFLAFFVYITLKGELPIYAGLLLLSPQTTGTQATQTTSTPTAQQQANSTNNEITNAAFNAAFAAFGL